MVRPPALVVRRFAAALSWSAICLLLGCTAAVVPLGPGSEVPPDLAINATVIRGGSAPRADRVELRSGRWLLLPDGSLRATLEADPAAAPPDHRVRPGVVRRLRDAEVEEIWRLAGRLGLADPANATISAPPASIDAGPRELVELIEFAGQGRSWAFLSRRPAASGGDPVLGQMIRALAERAWMADRPPELEPGAAIRYDFGPDPYDRYRTPAGAAAAGSRP